jgi:hypothetical protein
MTYSAGGEPPPGEPRGPWTDRVAISETDDGLPVAYRPNEVITTRGEEALEVARRLFPDAELHHQSRGPFTRLTGVPDPLLLIEELRLSGIVAQPNHVFFSHGADTPTPLYGSSAPATPTPLYGSPLYGSPLYGSPLYGSPLYGSPLYGSPLYGSAPSGISMCGCAPCRSPLYGTYTAPVTGSKVAGSQHVEPTRSSALPPPEVTPTALIEGRIRAALVPGAPEVIVLDTGLAAPAFRPPLGNGITAASPADTDEPDEDHDQYLDPAAGHGTFIAGVIAQIAPGCKVALHRVMSTFGDAAEWTVCNAIDELVVANPDRTILSLSFGGYVLERPPMMARTIRHAQHRGIHVVASAGNDATSRPCYPAALPGVVAVGALGPGGPAPFTNYGDWVDACAPGVDLLSSFFTKFNGPAPVGPYGDDPDDFTGWARWSGTSFSAPVVVGNAVRLMMSHDGPATATGALERLIDDTELLSLPCLGTVVNAL